MGLKIKKAVDNRNIICTPSDITHLFKTFLVTSSIIFLIFAVSVYATDIDDNPVGYTQELGKGEVSAGGYDGTQ